MGMEKYYKAFDALLKAKKIDQYDKAATKDKLVEMKLEAITK